MSKEIEVTALELINEAFECAIKDINKLAKDIYDDFQERGGITMQNATTMARDRYILAGIYLTGKPEEKKKMIAKIKKAKKEKVDE